MRLTRLEVEWFAGVKAATVELGPGLNVLYGPNDLGKSTLVNALRAVLLLPATSREGDAFHPWSVDQRPTVTLELCDDAGKHWRVKKTWGGPGTAQLWSSKDRLTWLPAEKARAVDEKLRTLLPWGIPSPGGKGAPKGMPASFIANALLARQGSPEEILSASLVADLAESGRLSLTRALSALAQDPLFKQVLDRAQAEFERFFNESGSRKTGRTSALTAASDAVKRLTAEREALEQQVAGASEAEQRAAMLRERRAELANALEAAQARLELARAGAALKKARDAAAQAQELAARAAAAKRTLDEAALALSRAEQAGSTDARQQRELLRAQAQARAAERARQETELEALAATAKAATEAQVALEQARTDATAATRAREQLAAAKEKAAAALKGAQGDLALAEAVVAYGRWRQAVDAATTAATTAAQAAQHAEDSAALLREAEQHDTRAKEALDDTARRRARLPGEEQLQKLERLAHDKAIAEAALGGGLTVTVRPRRPIALHAVADDGAPEAFAGLKTEQQLEAERRVQLTIGDLLDVEIVAGAKELRRAAEVLRRRWKEEMLPALERAEVASLADLQAAVKALAGSTTVAAQARAAAATARAAAEAAASRAALLRSQGSVSKAELDEREARIGDIDRAVLADLHRRAGAGWEKQVEEMKVKTTAAVEVARRALAELDAKLLEAGWRLDDAKQREAKAGEALPALRAVLGGLTPQQISSQLAELRAADGAPVSEREVDRAAPQLAEARERLQVAQAEHERAQAAAHAKAGEAQALAEAVSPEQRRRLEASAPVELAAAQAGLQQSQAQLDEVTADFNKADGALTSLAGPMARERQAQLDEALAAARVRERELLTDADSWRLLRDALREAESTESAHLGKALAGPVAARFSALTHGRYRAITFSPDLSTEAVEVPGAGGAEVLAALSEGTRDQLATLVRLAIASQLGSALVLDDQLVHTDLARLDWFGQVLREVAAQTQVLVVTCRPLDYLAPEQLPAQQPSLDSPGARAIDLSRLIERS